MVQPGKRKKMKVKIKSLLVLMIIMVIVLPVETILASVVVDTSGYFWATQTNSQKGLIRDSKGRLHTVYLKLYSTRQHVWIASSDDEGATWGNITCISSSAQTNNYAQSDPSIFCSPNDNLHVVWTGGHSSWTPGGQIMYKRKIETTGVWSSIIVVSQESPKQHTMPDLVVSGEDAWIFFASNHASTVNGIWRKIVYEDYSVSGWVLHSENLAGENFLNYNQDRPTVAQRPGTSSFFLAWEGQSSLSGGRDAIFGEFSYDTDQEQLTGSSTTEYQPSVIWDSKNTVHLAYATSAYGSTTNRQICYQHRDMSFVLLDGAYVSNYTGYSFNLHLQEQPNIGIDRYDRPYIAWSGNCVNHTVDDITFLRWREYNGDWQEIIEVYQLGDSNYPNLIHNIMSEVELVFWESQGTDEVRYEDFDISYPDDYPELVDLEIYDSWGNVLTDTWLFEGEVYNVSACFNNTRYGYLHFNDTEHEVRFEYDNRTGAYLIHVEAGFELVIGLISSNYVIDDTFTNVSWVFILDVNIIDCQNVSINWYAQNRHGNYTTGSSGEIINIYNLGGLVSYEFIGDSGRIVGGESIEIWGENSTTTCSAYSDVIWRRLQHVHLLFSLDVEDNDCFDIHENTGQVTMGIKLREDDTWVDSWYFILSVVNGAIDAGGGGAGKAWIIPHISWYSRQSDGVMTLIKSDILSGYPECGDEVSNDITHTRFYIDLWFNKMNQSTTVGGRVSTYYFGMDEGGWAFWTNWKPVVFNITESMFFDDLRSSNGNIINSKEVELVKFWVQVQKSGAGTGESCHTHEWSIRSPKLSWTFAGDRMQSLNTPDGVETIVIDMPSSGWLQPLAKAISALSTMIWSASLGFMKVFIGAIDSFLIFLHSPITMSQMINFLMIQASVISGWMNVILRYVSVMLDIFTRLVTTLLMIMDYGVNSVLWILINVVGFPFQILRVINALVSGESITIYDFLFDFGVVGELIDGIMQIAPISIGVMFAFWWLWGNIEGKGEVDIEGIPRRTLNIFKWAREAYSDMFWIYIRMKNEMISMYNFIRSHIPGLGGGGGESEE